jgi:hypothetical protein
MVEVDPLPLSVAGVPQIVSLLRDFSQVVDNPAPTGRGLELFRWYAGQCRYAAGTPDASVIPEVYWVVRAAAAYVVCRLTPGRVGAPWLETSIGSQEFEQGLGDSDFGSSQRHCLRNLYRTLNSVRSFLGGDREVLDNFVCAAEDSIRCLCYKPEQGPTGDDIEHALDFNWVRCCGVTFVFTRSQAIVVAALLDDYRKHGQGLGNEYLLDLIDSEAERSSKRLRDWFGHDHPAWNSLIVSDRKGVFRLDPTLKPLTKKKLKNFW